MFLELLTKEFIERRNKEKQSLGMTVFSGVLAVLFLSGFIALECFIAITLDKKLVKYSPYGSFDFLVLFLFLLMVVSIVFTMVKARSVIFDSNDNAVTLPLPIAPSTQVMSKVVYLYIEAVLFGLVSMTPLLFCYGISRSFIPHYYIFSILFPVFISFFSTGIALVFCLVYQLVYRQVKKSDIAQFVLACVLVIFLCYLYQFVLNLFLTALNDSSIGGMFSSSFVESLHNARYYFLPVYHLLDLLIEKTNMKSDILIFLGASLLSLVIGIGSVSVVFYHVVKRDNDSLDRQKKDKVKKLKLLSPYKVLLKKEIDLLFKDETNLFSYTSLLILCPFLTYAVISSLNSIIYDNLKFYASYFPELVSGINLTLILLFSGVINSSASMSMTREGKALIIVKYLPISPLKQILAKILIPVLFSFVSLLVTEIVLVSTGIVTLPVFFSSLFIGSLILLFTNAFGLYADMHDHTQNRRIRLSLLNEAIPLVLPFVLFILFFLLSVLFHLPSWALYLIVSLFSLLVFSPFLIGMKKRYERAFMRMEVNN